MTKWYWILWRLFMEAHKQNSNGCKDMYRSFLILAVSPYRFWLYFSLFQFKWIKYDLYIQQISIYYYTYISNMIIYRYNSINYDKILEDCKILFWDTYTQYSYLFHWLHHWKKTPFQGYVFSFVLALVKQTCWCFKS